LAILPGEPAHQPPRTDLYLRLADDDSLSIKVREGRLEIKQLVRHVGTVHLHDHAEGVLQTWRKWSFPLAPSPEMQGTIAGPDSCWIPVHKKRRLLCYGVSDGDRILVLPLPLHTLPTQGCALELAAVQIAGQTWWSVALEAFGPEDVLCDAVLRTGQQVFSAGSPPLLEERCSLSYPEWLCMALAG
jgi:hypothetical protein